MMQKNDLTNDRCGCRVEARERCVSERRDTCEIPRYVKCGCGEPQREPSWGLRGYPLASVYSVLHDWQDIYDLDTALKRGTIFKELDLPFSGGSCLLTDHGRAESRCDECDNESGRFGGGRNGR